MELEKWLANPILLFCVLKTFKKLRFVLLKSRVIGIMEENQKKRKAYKDLTQKLINILNDDYDKDSPEMNLKMLRKMARKLKI